MPGIVLDKQKIVYWPIPKNANSALKIRIAELLGLDWEPRTGKGVEAAPFKKTDLPIEGYKNVAIVRHPGARLYSLYANKILLNIMGIFAPYPRKFWQGMSFDSFVEAIINIPMDDADPHFALQSSQLPLETIARCVTYKLEDVAPLLGMLINKTNATKYSARWITHYTEEKWYRMVHHYQEDFRRFNYSALFNG